MDARFKLHRNTQADWIALRVVLLPSEIGHEIDTNRFKIGDGTLLYGDPNLPYFIDEHALNERLAEIVSGEGSIGPQGPIGLTGPQGDTGPEGPPGIDGLGLASGGSLLWGQGAPSSGSNQELLDGVNDPWRWSQRMEAWVGPAYSVTWVEGDTIPYLSLPADSPECDLLISNPDLISADVMAQHTYHYVNGMANPIGDYVMSDSGSGVAFILQYQPWVDTTKTHVPDSSLDISTMLGTVTIVEEWPWPEPEPIGNEGDFYLDLSMNYTDYSGPKMHLYGPRDAFGWPSTYQFIRGWDKTEYHTLVRTLRLVPDPEVRASPVLIIDAGDPPMPDNFFYGQSQMVLWYDDTEGAPSVKMRGADSAGTFFDLSTGGSVGPQGPPGVSSGFEHIQATPAATWTVPHDLGRRPLVTLYDDLGALIETDIDASSSTVVVTFPIPVAGSLVLT